MHQDISRLGLVGDEIASKVKRTIWIASSIVILLGWLNEGFEAFAPTFLDIPQLRLFDTQASLANWLEPTLLAVAASLFLVTSRAAKISADVDAGYWTGLSVLFALLSLDEALNLHEMILKPLRTTVGVDRVAIWMAPAFVGAIITGVCFVPLLRHIPANFAQRFVWSATIFVGGCIVVEAISQIIATRMGVSAQEYRTAACIEETMEILGVALLCCCLIDHFQDRWQTIVVQKVS